MSLNELELKRIDHTVGELCRRKTRPEHADQLRFECEIDGHTVTIWEVRPPWDGRGDHTRMGIARFRFFRSRGVWIVYWMRRDLRWHRYGPAPSTPDLAALVAIVEADEYRAFFGADPPAMCRANHIIWRLLACVGMCATRASL